MKKILITGKGSYIGTSFHEYMEKWPMEYKAEFADLHDDAWKNMDFSEYDVLFHVAGIAHIKETKENASLYYKINRDLAIETAKKAKKDGVKQFIFMGSMSVYGKNTGIITKDTEPHPVTNYGNSKYQAEKALAKLADNQFSVVILRTPLVYGKNCKGNFQKMIHLVRKLPVFPQVDNQRSMIYIDNLSSFVKECIDRNLSGIYFPQNKSAVNTSEMAALLAKAMAKQIHRSSFLGICVSLCMPFSKTIQKGFGTLIYKDLDKTDFPYCIVEFEESIRKSIGE